MRRALAVLLLSNSFIIAQVPFERLVHSSVAEPGSWLTYSGDYSGHRFSGLSQLTPANVAGLRLKWMYQVEDGQMHFETSPIVVGDVMYISEPPSNVTALDAHTGRPLWRYKRPLPKGLQTVGFWRTNRGVAILNNIAYVGTLDAHLVALDVRSGAVRWDVPVANYKAGYSITGAPLALKDIIVIGVSGGEAGVRGFIDGYDANTGRQAWRFWTVPGPGNPGHETWGGDSWKTGGAPTWLTGSYDPDADLIYWGVGNPGPDWNGDSRPGDNLYSCSLVALERSSGKLRWWFQFTPHDTHDWDATEIPVLFDISVKGKTRQTVAMANRNGFYYLLDRLTGEFLASTAFAKQTWTRGLDAKGRPVVLAGAEPTDQGSLLWPSVSGATNWFSPSFDPNLKTFFVSVRERGSYYFKNEVIFRPGQYFVGGGERALPPGENYGAIRALDAASGAKTWEFRLLSPPWAGLMSSAGGLVFGGSEEGNFYALDSRTGQPHWEIQLGGPVRANPISFLVDGNQMVAIAAGNALMVFGL